MTDAIGQRPIGLSIARAAWMCAHLTALLDHVRLPDVHRRRVERMIDDLRTHIGGAAASQITGIDLDALREGMVKGDAGEDGDVFAIQPVRPMGVTGAA